MRTVNIKWLRFFQITLLAIDAIVIIFFLFQFFTGELSSNDETIHSIDGFSIPLLVPVVMASTHALYNLTVVWWLDKKQVWLAHAPSVLLSGLLLVMLSNLESPLHNWAHLILIVFMFFASMVGAFIPTLIGISSLILLMVGSIFSGEVSDPGGYVVEMILIAVSLLSAAGGWYFIRTKLEGGDGPNDLSSLNNLVKQEQTTVNVILESISDGVLVINQQGLVQVINESLVKILGWSKTEAVSLQYNTLFPSAIQAEKTEKGKASNSSTQSDKDLAITKSIDNKSPSQAVSLIKNRDNKEMYLDISASPIMQGEKIVGTIAVVRDVDKQKREEQQRSEFISTASHEMRTPVAAIEGYLALAMNDKVSTIDIKARSYLDKAHESTRHLGKLFQDLLTSTKAEDGRLTNHPVAVEMGSFLDSLVDTLKFSAEKKGLLMDFVVGAGTPEEQSTLKASKVIKPLYYVNVDPDRLREVITNLFDNAVKYTPEGKISIGLTGNREVVQLYIKDTGPGIPSADIPHLFQKFYRVDNSATRTIGGTGLGLFICRKIIEIYKGRIWVESVLEKGSTFYINLPRLTTKQANEMQTAESAQAANTSALDK